SSPTKAPSGKSPSGPLHERLASVPVTPHMVEPSAYPASVAGWNDQLLASVKDFTVVLLALREGTPTSAPASAASPVGKSLQAPEALGSLSDGAAAAAHITGGPAPLHNGQLGSAPDLSHLMADATPNHTGWTGVRLDDAALDRAAGRAP